jgi:hypothetical protein
MRKRVAATIGLAAAVMTQAAWQTPDPITVLPASVLTVEGKSTLRDWKCKAGLVQSAITSQGEDPIRLVAGGEKAITAVELTIPIAKLDCSNGTMNEHMQKALKAKDNPAISFRLGTYDLKAAAAGQKAALNGVLKIAGAEQPVAIDADVSVTPEGALKVSGSYAFAMTKFGVKPPSLMLGTMKVKDEVVVRFEMLLDR